MTWLLDGNILLAMALRSHVHRRRCLNWFTNLPAADKFATCAVTEGTLLRIHMQLAEDTSAAAAWRTLGTYHDHPQHTFWADGFSYSDIDPTRLTGHRQVTDSWLAALAARKGGKLATLDASLSVLWPDPTFLIPV